VVKDAVEILLLINDKFPVKLNIDVCAVNMPAFWILLLVVPHVIVEVAETEVTLKVPVLWF